MESSHIPMAIRVTIVAALVSERGNYLSIVRFRLTGDGYLRLPAGTPVEMRLVHTFEMQDRLISKEIGYEMRRPGVRRRRWETQSPKAMAHVERSYSLPLSYH